MDLECEPLGHNGSSEGKLRSSWTEEYVRYCEEPYLFDSLDFKGKDRGAAKVEGCKG